MVPRTPTPPSAIGTLDDGTPVFAGTDTPIGALVGALARGESPEQFLEAHPSVPLPTLLAVLHDGLQGLLAPAGLLRQGSLLPQTDAAGVITNAEELTAGQVIGNRVRCPACHDLVFHRWPEGWDGHAAYRCAGVPPGSKARRKQHFKWRFGHLFRR